MNTFDISHDRRYKIPFIKQAMQTAGGKLNLFASPWSPPAWVKDNNNMLHGGNLLPAFYGRWAQYFAKFVKAYEKEGIPVWGVSIQNEPMATQRWESCIYSVEEERDFLKNHLGPTFQREGLGSKKAAARRCTTTSGGSKRPFRIKISSLPKGVRKVLIQPVTRPGSWVKNMAAP